MTLWQWVLVVLGAWAAIALVVALGVGALLGSISRRLNELDHDWASEPLSRERAANVGDPADRAEDEEAIASALRG